MLPIWLQKLLGGRPMIRVEALDVDDFGDPVCSYIDCLGRFWKACNRWDLLRERIGHECSVKKESRITGWG